MTHCLLQATGRADVMGDSRGQRRLSGARRQHAERDRTRQPMMSMHPSTEA